MPRKDAVVAAALAAIAGVPFSWLNPRASALRALWWYTLFCRRR